jgi:RND family efflux transporter MFP subunit
MTLESSALGETVKLPGVLQPFEYVEIYPKVNGFVQDVLVDRGSKVRKGQVLMRLEAPELEQQVSAAKLRYIESKANFNTSKDRYDRLLITSRTPGTVSAADLTASYSKMMADSASLQESFAGYQAQKAMYAYLTVTAPFDGVITERNIHPGALAGPGGGKPAFILQQENKLRLVMNVPEQYVAQVNDGQRIHFTLESIPGKTFEGRISRASGALSDKYRSEATEVDVDNSSGFFKAGMYAEVLLKAKGNATGFKVPKAAVITTTENKYVVKLEDGKAQFVNVSEGNESGDSTEVFGELTAGSVLVADPTYEIAQGQKINGGQTAKYK